MANQAFLDDGGIIWEVYQGDQDGPKIDKMRKDTEGLIDQLEREGKSVRMIVDMRELGKTNLQARRSGVIALKQWPLERLAVFGAHPYLAKVVNFMFMATGYQKKAELFATQDEAMAWLKNNE